MRDFTPDEIPADIRHYFEEVMPETGGLIAHPT